MYPYFGRYSDSYKTESKNRLWWNSVKLFEEKKYLDSFETFLNYLKDDELDNVRFNRNDDEIKFELLQGSKLIKGIMSNGKVSAESQIAEFEKPTVSFMRKLMELNYTQYYCRFALKDNIVCIKFDSSVADSHPRKLYHALRELATKADKQDDLLIENFSTLKPVKNTETYNIPEDQLRIKYKYFRKWIEDALSITSKLNEDSFAGGISYVLLDTIYKIDYLIAPEGNLMEKIESLSFRYFAKDNRPYVEKNREIRNTLEKFLNTQEDKIIKDFTISKYTFGIPSPANHETLLDIISKNIGSTKLYIDNHLPEIAIKVFEYIFSHSLFNYALPEPDANLLEIAMKIINQDYFTELGYGEVLYKTNSNTFNERKIKKEINKVIEKNHKEYPKLIFNTDNLKFSSITDFMKSYINELTQLNLTR